MRRHLATAVVALGVLLGAGSGVAAADTPTQAAQQSAGTFQGASSTADSTQVAPSNSAISVRIGSPGDDGSVSQSNTSLAGSLAGNAAKTDQTASQSGGSGTQAADQSAKTGQWADSSASSTQVKPSNSAISVRIGSGGNDGSVDQSNKSGALSAAGNAAHTTQTATQDASGDSCGCHGGGATQGVEQSAKTGQSATSDATSKQIKPSNSAISVRIHSPGDNGSVDQSNNSGALSAAGNLADTTQSATQDPSGSCGCHGGGGSTQAAGQFADTHQKADSDATSEQVHPSNSAISVRIGSGGNDGDVSQSNNSLAGSFAGNAAKTDQTVDQEQGSGSGGNAVQAADQEATTLQGATSHATSEQLYPSNDATSVRIGSGGNNGSVDQSNNSAALSFAGNLADTTQSATQDPSGSCGCHGGDQVQALGQFSTTGQWADSDATSKQIGASNSATPVRIGGDHGSHGSPCGCDGNMSDGHTGHSAPMGGDNGSVSQSNTSLALSGAFNKAKTDQTADQEQGSGSDGCGCQPSHESTSHPCGCSGAGVQGAGQFATTGQWAGSSATSKQIGASNSATPVRIHSGGSNGSVEQSNLSLAASLALNLARTRQEATQEQ